MTRGMNTMPTHRRGRTHYTPGAADNRGFSGFCSVLFLLILLLAPPILLMGTETARHGRYIALSHAMDSDIIELGRDGHRNLEGQLAHGISSDIDTIASDGQVGVSIPGALALRRNTQYCQWSEHQSKQCQKCTREVKASDGSSKTESYDCNCVTQYDYVKKWRDHRINSLMFDQPGAHHNPQRDPMPSATFLGDAVVTVPNRHHGHRSGETRVHLHQDMLSGIRNQPFRSVDFVPNGRAPEPSFLSRIFTRFFGPSNTRYEPMRMLRDTVDAPAHTRENFVYVGQGGYFFSPYENPSTTQRLFNYFVQYMEGSLFDWQLGDLMPSCTAGDVRFSYTAQDPATVSFLGEVADARSSTLEMTPRSLIINGAQENIGFVHAGHHSAENMIIAEDNASRNTALIFRVLLLLWSIPAARLIGVALGREVGESSLSSQISATVGLFATLLSGTWLVIWGNEVGSRDSLILFAMGGYFTVIALRSSVRRGRGRWWNGVWCRIGLWANLPPEWRLEDSYIPAPADEPSSKRFEVEAVPLNRNNCDTTSVLLEAVPLKLH